MRHDAHAEQPLPWGESGLSIDDLSEQVAGLSGRINAATCEWLGLVAEADSRGAWQGFTSCASWLSWRCGIGPGTASDHLRVARALLEMPQVRDRFATGALSFSQVRALTRARGILDESTLLDLALHATGAQLERLIRGLRKAATADEEDEADIRQHATWHTDDDGSFVIRARLTGEAAATMQAALEACAGDSRPQTLATVAATALSATGPAYSDAAVMVVANVDALNEAVAFLGQSSAEDSLHPEVEVRWEPNGVPASTHTLAMLLCDRQVGLMAKLKDGSLVDLGRSRRRPNTAITRTVFRRHDHRCAVPTCRAKRHLHLHHVRHWAHGGSTSADNLVPLCGAHHRQLHLGLLDIRSGESTRWEFLDRFGQSIQALPPIPVATERSLIRGVAVTASHGHPLHLGYAVSTLLSSAA